MVWYRKIGEVDNMSDSCQMRRYDFYLCGPMRGYPDLNYPLFNSVTRTMVKNGLLIYNPAAYDGGVSLGETDITFAFCMLRDLNAVINLCDGIALLPGWRDSLGGNIECFVAFACGKKIVEIIFRDGDNDRAFNLVPLDPSDYCLPYKKDKTIPFNPHKCRLDSFTEKCSD